MYASRIRAAGLVIAASLGLSACMTPYGYNSVGVGIGSGGYYGDYGYGGYGYPHSGYGYGYPSYGWYDDFYYPGSGYYVYSRDGSRHRWTDSQRRYWETRRDRRDNDGLRIYQPRAGTTTSQVAPSTQVRRANRVERSSTKRQERVERREVRRGGLKVNQQSRRKDRDD